MSSKLFLSMTVWVGMITPVTGVPQSVDSRVTAEWLDEYSACRLASALGRWGTEYEYWRKSSSDWSSSRTAHSKATSCLRWRSSPRSTNHDYAG